MLQLSCQYIRSYLVSEREEEEVDLSLVLPEPNVSLNYCIEQYSAGEKLTGKNKFKCDKCGELQDAEKKTLIKTLSSNEYLRYNILAYCQNNFEELAFSEYGHYLIEELFSFFNCY